MYDYSQYQEEKATFVNDAESLLDGNFAVVEQSYALELLFVDDSTPVLSICWLGNGEVFDPTSFESFDYANAPKRYFTGDISTDAIVELYYSLIRHRDVDKFLEMFAGC